MPSITVAAAQTKSSPGNIGLNLSHHLSFIEKAAQENVQLLVFPELSLTGYEPALARSAAIYSDDPLLQPLREITKQLGITVVVGAPLKNRINDTIHIAALSFSEDGSLSIYTKKHLHPGEEVAFASGTGGAALSISAHSVALVVCADFSHASHAQNAAAEGADIYAVSALITEPSYTKETGWLQNYASLHGMAVLLANHSGATGGWLSAGKSAVWTEYGSLVIAAQDDREVLLIAEKNEGAWSGKLIEIPI